MLQLPDEVWEEQSLEKSSVSIENRVEKQMRREVRGESGSINTQIVLFWPRRKVWMISPLLGAIFNAWGEVNDDIGLPEWLDPLFCGSRDGYDSDQCFFHLEAHERHTGDREWLRSDHFPAPLFKHGPTEEAGLCVQPLDSHLLGIAFNGFKKS